MKKKVKACVDLSDRTHDKKRNKVICWRLNNNKLFSGQTAEHDVDIWLAPLTDESQQR